MAKRRREDRRCPIAFPKQLREFLMPGIVWHLRRYGVMVEDPEVLLSGVRRAFALIGSLVRPVCPLCHGHERWQHVHTTSSASRPDVRPTRAPPKEGTIIDSVKASTVCFNPSSKEKRGS